MVRTSGVTMVPFTAAGHLCHFEGDGYRWDNGERTGPEWRPNAPFRNVLRMTGMHSGRSAKYVELTDRDGYRYPMFVTDLLDLLERSGSGVRAGWTGSEVWIVRKRGRNYGLALAPEGTTVPRPA